MSFKDEYIAWSDDLSVGLQEIDEQHKVLTNLINRLFNEAIMHKADRSVISGILNELVQYTIVHFAVEESLFRIFDYPGIEPHQKEHEQLKQKVVDFQKSFEDGNPIDVELMGFLRKWLKDHIMISDKRYTNFFLEKGFKPHWAKQQSWVGKVWNSISRTR